MGVSQVWESWDIWCMCGWDTVCSRPAAFRCFSGSYAAVIWTILPLVTMNIAGPQSTAPCSRFCWAPFFFRL